MAINDSENQISNDEDWLNLCIKLESTGTQGHQSGHPLDACQSAVGPLDPL